MSSRSFSRARCAVWALALVSSLVGGCGSQSPADAPRGGVSGAPRIRLPADQAAHPAARNEWWYLVGHLRAGGRTFGYETTIFKFKNIRPPGISSPITLYRTDVAITDEAGGRFYQRVTYHFPASARLSSRTLALRVGPASLAGASPRSMRLRSRLPAGALELALSSRRPAMYVGGSGYIGFGNGFTYYYSLTDVATRGTLRLRGRTYAVTGVSWLDHQWGNWSWSRIRGWTWMALQLGNGVQLSVFDVQGGKRVRMASVLPAGNRTRTLRRITITSLGTWRSPHTGARYPSGWTVRIPAARATLRVLPTVRDQELVAPGQARGSYWEGSGRVSGVWHGRPVRGLSYTELTGYAGSLSPSR